MTDNQLFFPGFEPSPPPKTRFKSRPRGSDNIFFAVRVDAATEALAVAHFLKTEHALSGKLLKPENLHVTLFALGEYDGVPDGLEEIATQIALTIHAAPFDAIFDIAMSFGVEGDARLVLCGSDVAALSALQKQFSEKFESTFKGGTQKTPHVTLLYGDKVIAKQAIEPVRWLVHEFVLIHSLVKQGKHEILGRWPLQSGQA